MGSSVPSEEPMGDSGFPEEPSEEPSEPAAEKPFDDTPFDAGVEADEEASPEKYIQQLAGKLGQSLRSYSNDSGQPDFDLEKFAINSVLSATHTAEMDPNDQADIISKVKSSGDDGEPNTDDGAPGGEFDMPDENGEEEGGDSNIDLGDIDMEESHNPNPMGQTVFQDETLGVKDKGMEENKYLNLESTKKSSIFVDNIKTMIRQQLMESPTVLPITKPIVKPSQPRPTRKGKPFRITPREIPNPQPKAMNEGGDDDNEIIFMNLVSQSNIEELFVADFKVGDIPFTDKEFKNTSEHKVPKNRGCNENDPWVYKYDTEPMGDERKVYSMFVTFKCDIVERQSNNFMYLGDTEDAQPKITEH